MWLFCPLFLNGSTFQAQWSAKPKSQPDNARPTHLISTLPSLFSDILLQFSSVTQSCPTLCDPMNHSRPGFPVHHQLPGFTQTHAHWVGDAIQPSHPLSFPSPPIFNLSQHQGFFFFFSNESVLHTRWPKYLSFSFNISPSNEHSELISFLISWYFT